jgi:asparagine synthase (glutamine-hydrolysing)
MAMMPTGIGSILQGAANSRSASAGYMNRAFLLRQLSYGVGKPASRQSVYWMSAVPPRSQKALWLDAEDVEASLAKALDTQFSDTNELSLIEQCQQHFINYYLANDILQKMDRASMYVSLEVRSPYLSAAVAEYALSLPVSALHKGMTGKRILRDVARSYLPEQTVSRKKHGFALPVSALLRSDLRDLAQSTLLDSSNEMYACVDFATVNDWWSQHMAGKRDHGKALWSLMMLAAFFRNQF